jgi:homoserine O-acetyltransferase
MHFPNYDYDDMVASQHAMLEDGLHIDHLRLIFGTSMGCMQTFTWGEAYPNAMDGLAAFACLPVELAGRNRIWRDMAMQDIKLDPAWKHGNYKHEPLAGLRGAFGLTIIAGSGAIELQKAAPDGAQAEAFADRVISQAVAHNDANDFLYYVNASRNYNPEAKLGTITAPVLWVNSADDFVNPAELGVAEKMVTRLPHGKFVLLPMSDITRGHYTFMQAAVWKQYVADFMTQTAK